MAEESSKFESAVSFLERAREVCPDVPLLLNSLQLVALDFDPTQPFDPSTLNEDGAKLIEAFFVTKHSIYCVKENLRCVLMEPLNKEKEVDSSRKQSVIECLKMVQERIKSIWDSKLHISEKQRGEQGLPRIIRLSRRLKLSEKETMVLIYAFITQVSSSRNNYSASLRFTRVAILYGNDTLAVCKACDVSIGEIVNFLDTDREHMQQGLFPDVQRSYVLHSAIAFDEVFCKALVGVPLKDSEFLKLEQTHLADIIAEEEGNEHFRAGQRPGSSADEPMKPPSVVTAAHTDDGKEGISAEGGDTVEDMVTKEEGKTSAVAKVNMDVDDLDDLLRQEREREKQTNIMAPPDVNGENEISSDKITAYKNDLDYLDDNFQLIAQKLKVKGMESRMEMEAQYDEEMRDGRTLRQKREAESKFKVLEKKCEKRLSLTRMAGDWIPRLERMVVSRGLCAFEKSVLITLIGFVIQPNKINTLEGLSMFGNSGSFNVGELLRLFCGNLKEQIKHRMYFYKNSTLVREGMIVVNSSGLTGDPTTAKVEIDRRMLDFCVGLDTEFSEIVEGSHLYYPKTKFNQVILSKEQKQLILSTVTNFDAYKRYRKRIGLDDVITYGAGMVMLFHGPPGTGKTMMANALANQLGKKVLLINFPSLGSMSAGENFKFIFREAKINDAILFFDECEAIFESREKGSHDVNMLLTEIERHDGLIIMATNRPYDLDEAMHRRIMIAVEFRQPDHLLRKAIWESHVPKEMKLSDDIDLGELSLRFELTGGFIKNAVLSALSIAVSREGDNPIVRQADLLKGANLQLRGRLKMKDFHRRLIPKAGLDKIILPEELTRSLQEIVQFEKARSVLFGQWGFSATEQQGITVLLHGAPGTGKSLAAEAIGYEVGKPLKVVNCGELLSKWVGESTKNIEAIFEEAKHSDAILVFDEAEGLFGARTSMSTSTDRYANVDVGVLLYHIERFTGIIVLTTNIIDNIDKAFFRRLKFVLAFDVPSFKLRKRIWKLLIPPETPVSEDVDYEKLSEFEVCGGDIKSAIFRAASRAALRPEAERKLTMTDLVTSAEEEMGKGSRNNFRRQDSDTARMYN